MGLNGERAIFVRRGLVTTKTTDLGDPKKLSMEPRVLCDLLWALPETDQAIRVCMTKQWSRALQRSGAGSAARSGLAPAAG